MDTLHTVFGKQFENQQLIQRRKWITATLFFCNMNHGIWLALLGAGLVDLQQIMNVNSQEISTIITWRNVGILFGCLFGGHLTYRINQHIFLGIDLLVMGVSYIGISWCTELLYFNIILAFQGLFGGFHLLGGTAFILDIWGHKAVPFVQMSFVAMFLGATISPQLAKPFLSSTDMDKSTDVSWKHFSSVTDTTDTGLMTNNSDSFLQMTISANGSGYTSLSIDTTTQVSSEHFENNIKFAFIITGLFLLLGSLLHLCHFFVSRCNTKHVHLIQETSGTHPADTVKGITSKLFQILTICLIGIAAFVFGGHEETLGNFLVDYTVTGLHWDKGTGTDITSVYWASDTMSRVLAAILSNKLSVGVLMGCSAFIILISNILMTFTVTLTSITLWIGVAGSGLGLGSLPGVLLIMSKSVILKNDLASMLICVTMYSGKVATPPLIGFFFQNDNYEWFIYIGLVFSFVMFVVYLLLTALKGLLHLFVLLSYL